MTSLNDIDKVSGEQDRLPNHIKSDDVAGPVVGENSFSLLPLGDHANEFAPTEIVMLGHT